jgi:acyl carrier protein
LQFLWLPEFLSILPPGWDGFTRFAKTDIPSLQFADRTSPAFGAGSRSNSSDDRMNDTKVIGCLFRWRKLPVSDITDKVIAIVGDQLDVPKEEITRDSSFVDHLKADSLDIVELVMALEDEFEVKIPDEDYDKIKTVGNAIDYINGKSKS